MSFFIISKSLLATYLEVVIQDALAKYILAQSYYTRPNHFLFISYNIRYALSKHTYINAVILG
jgi:hypothetical protein